MAGKLEDGWSLSSSSSKRRRRSNNDDDDCGMVCSCCGQRVKQHLYLALDDWNGGYSIHKLEVDDILDQEPPAAAGGSRRRVHKLPEPAAVRIASPLARGPMEFAAVGTSIFVSTNPPHPRHWSTTP